MDEVNRQAEILLVDDNSSDADLALRALRRRNLANNVYHAKDGEMALNRIFPPENPGEVASNLPALILLDLKMPKVDGIEVLRRVKSDPRTKKIPVIVLTSSREDPDIERCYELGANSYIVKPVEFEVFSKVVADLGFYWMMMNEIGSRNYKRL